MLGHPDEHGTEVVVAHVDRVARQRGIGRMYLPVVVRIRTSQFVPAGLLGDLMLDLCEKFLRRRRRRLVVYEVQRHERSGRTCHNACI